MKRFAFPIRKAGPAEKPKEPSAASEDPLDLDHELFSDPGGESGALRKKIRPNANFRISDLDTVKSVLGKLRRAFEAEKSAKAVLQAELDKTRAAHGKLRDEVVNIEKKFAAVDRDDKTLRQTLAATQQQLRALEAAKAENAAALQAHLAQQTDECLALREQNRHLDGRLAVADKRTIALESNLGAAHERLLIAEDETRAQHALRDAASAETARLSHKLAETEANLHAAQARLRDVEAELTEIASERAGLADRLDALNARYERDLSDQNNYVGALEAHVAELEKVLAEARELLFANAEQLGEHNRRNGEMMKEHNALQARLSDLQIELRARDSELDDADRTRTIYLERNAKLVRAFIVKDAEIAQATQDKALLDERIGALEATYAAERRTAEQAIEELVAALRHEKTQRVAVEEALAAARADVHETTRDGTTPQQKPAADEPAAPRAANAA